jgi:alpha-ribazole phosphatase/probable phosphoglycerate mutase
VFCSDLKRAVDSAKLTFEDSMPIIIDSRLRECNYGRFNGFSSDIVEPMQETSIIERFEEGESYEDVKLRIKDFLEFLKKNYEGKKLQLSPIKLPNLR